MFIDILLVLKTKKQATSAYYNTVDSLKIGTTLRQTSINYYWLVLAKFYLFVNN